MAGSGPQQISPPYAESANVHQQSELHNLEHGNHIDNQQEGNSQKVGEGGRWDKHSSSDLHDQQIEGQDQWEGGI